MIAMTAVCGNYPIFAEALATRLIVHITGILAKGISKVRVVDLERRTISKGHESDFFSCFGSEGSVIGTDSSTLYGKALGLQLRAGGPYVSSCQSLHQ
jgi:hypothetical protein